MVDSSFTEIKLCHQQIRNLGIGNVLSRRVSVGEHSQLRVDCYPRGYRNDGCGEHMSLSMFLTTKSRNIRAVFEAFVLCTDGASQSHAKRSVQVGAPHRVGSARWERFMRRGDLETLCAANGVVRLVCGAMVVHENPIAVPVPDAGDHLGRLPDRADASDVSFSVRGHVFHAHSAVLASRSPAFRAELLGPMAEARLRRITLHNIEPATFRSLLWFVYTDALPPRRDLFACGVRKLSFFQFEQSRCRL